ncbi:DUF6879 family protein [Streptomyces sp. NPDC051555]|uniref:DUF6879 family protein n=1 Tax=Streptomyces sp. NPDC051555 TaxID=3365657 RepID=UPI0037AD18CB
MAVTRLVGECEKGTCATLYRVDGTGDLLVQGYDTTDAETAGQEWSDEVRGNIDAGKRMYRVHIISRPMTDYLRFELGWGYQKNAKAGEEFFILDTTNQLNPLEGVPDFWMFDESSVVSMNYAEGGKFLGAESHTSPAEWLERRDVALSRAVPFADWWEQYGEV